jgi:hypothetical protein
MTAMIATVALLAEDDHVPEQVLTKERPVVAMVDGQVLANIAQGTRPIDPQRLILDLPKVLRLLILRPIPTIRPILTRQQTHDNLPIQTARHRVHLNDKRVRFQQNSTSSAVKVDARHRVKTISLRITVN